MLYFCVRTRTQVRFRYVFSLMCFLPVDFSLTLANSSYYSAGDFRFDLFIEALLSISRDFFTKHDS